MADSEYSHMSDEQLAQRHNELEQQVNDPQTGNWWKARRECDDCQREIDRRRKGKEWAAGYFGGRRLKGGPRKGGYNKKGKDVPDVPDVDV